MLALSLPPSVPVSQVGRAAHDVGLAGMLGGQLFGRMALHPAVTRISDPRERGEVVNAAWRRYGAVNGIGLLAVTSGWIGARAAGVTRGVAEQAICSSSAAVAAGGG